MNFATVTDDAIILKVLDDEPVQRKKGRPKGSKNRRGRKQSSKRVKRTSKKKSRKGTQKASLPTKQPEFTFNTIAANLQSIILPSKSWKAYYSVPKELVCFSRREKNGDRSVKADRKVKFYSNLNPLIRINGKKVKLLASPESVGRLQDVGTLLEIVHDITANDPTLEYEQP